MTKIYNKIVEILNKIPPFILAFVVSLIIFGIAFYKMRDLNMQNLILAMTFFAIFWYSLETRKLKNATRFANAMQAEPLLALQYGMIEGKNELYIVNYGNSPAFNIKITTETGSFNFSSSTPLSNPLGHMETRILLSSDNQTNQNMEAEITLCCDTFDEKVTDERKRRYEVSTAKDGYYIKYQK